MSAAAPWPTSRPMRCRTCCRQRSRCLASALWRPSLDALCPQPSSGNSAPDLLCAQRCGRRRFARRAARHSVDLVFRSRYRRYEILAKALAASIAATSTSAHRGRPMVYSSSIPTIINGLGELIGHLGLGGAGEITESGHVATKGGAEDLVFLPAILDLLPGQYSIRFLFRGLEEGGGRDEAVLALELCHNDSVDRCWELTCHDVQQRVVTIQLALPEFGCRSQAELRLRSFGRRRATLQSVDLRRLDADGQAVRFRESGKAGSEGVNTQLLPMLFAGAAGRRNDSGSTSAILGAEGIFFFGRFRPSRAAR